MCGLHDLDHNEQCNLDMSILAVEHPGTCNLLHVWCVGYHQHGDGCDKPNEASVSTLLGRANAVVGI
eukprot:6055353-Prorocentrum_lima.AAC.1